MSELNISTVLAAKFRHIKVASPQPKPRAGNTASESGQINGFGPMTRITTSFGEFPAQTLRIGDRVLTKEGIFLPIVSLKRMTFDSEYLNYHPGAQPVVIRAGAYSQRIPANDVMFAPSQKLNTEQPFIARDAAKAIDAINRKHVYRKSENMITYTIFHCGRPAAVRCEGLWVDTAP